MSKDYTHIFKASSIFHLRLAKVVVCEVMDMLMIFIQPSHNVCIYHIT